MSVRLPIFGFTGGEWAPSLYGRNDLQKYPTACRVMYNFFPHPHGGASNRGGTEFVVSAKYPDKVFRLVPFTFSILQAYALEFGDQYIRVIKDGGQVVMTLAGTTAWLTGQSYTVGMFRKQSDVIYYCIVAHTSGTFATDLAAGKWVAQDAVEIPTPYLEADLALLKFEQSADTLSIWHPSYPEAKLTRSSHTAWTYSTITYAPLITAPTGFARSAGSATGYNYVVTAVSADGEESVASSSVAGGRGDTFTWSAVTGADHYCVYEGNSGYYFFIGYAATLSFTIPSATDIDIDTTLSPPKATNPFNGANNYPGCGAYHEQRLVRARTNNKPQSLFGSVTASFENMDIRSPLRDDDAYTFAMNAKQVNEIRWLASLNELIIGTSAAEWKCAPGPNSDAIVPTKPPNLKVQSNWGVSHHAPIIIGDTLLFVDASEAAVRDFMYSLEKDGYSGNDLSLYAPHFFDGHTIKEWAYQQHPDSIVWCIRDDGKRLGLTYYREHQIWGWHLHDTDGIEETICSLPVVEGANEVYIGVKRTINGNTVRYIERMKKRLPTSDIADAWFLDCAQQYDGAATKTLSGLGHLEGKDVGVLADGNVVKGRSIVSGALTPALSHAAEKILVGLPYEYILSPMDIEFQSQQGTTQGDFKDADSIYVRLKDTRTLFAGPSLDDLNEVKFREDEDYGEPTAMYSGDKELLVEPGDNEQLRLYFKGVDPVPCTVLAVVVKASNGDV